MADLVYNLKTFTHNIFPFLDCDLYYHSLSVRPIQAQIDKNAAAIEEVKAKTDQIEIRVKTYTEIITEDMVWSHNYNDPLNISVRLFGGGASGDRGGGGGGHMATWSGAIQPKEQVNITIGKAPGGNGGTTSFGTYISANGGTREHTYSYRGGSGGTGGGGTVDIGGNGSYGGGGGGGGKTASTSGDLSGNAGGSGGTYGGGGGGGGGASKNSSLAALGGSGGTGGKYGGKGGNGGSNPKSSGSAQNGNSGTNTNNISPKPEFYGLGLGGSSGNSIDYTINGKTATIGGGGGGGGGYGGNGGSGSSAYCDEYLYSSGAGGGGGGYGANGGNASSAVTGHNNTNAKILQQAAGGGGGGYGGRGGDGYSAGKITTTVVRYAWSGQGYGAGGGGADNSTFGVSLGGGGGGYGTIPPSTQKNTGNNGICIISYTVKEIVPTE